MRYRKLSSSGDYTFGGSQLNFFINDPEGVAQAVTTALRLIQGEWYLDTTSGTPYFAGIMGFNTQAQVDTIFQQEILNVTVIDSTTLAPVQGVTSIENFSSTFNPSTRKYAMTATLNTIYGKAALEVTQ